VLNGHPHQRLPGSLHLTIEGCDAKGLIASLPQVALSDGSACETDRDPDYVLKAIGRPEAAHHSIRCQVGRSTTPEEIDRAAELLVAGVTRMRAFQ
jgi:cysteine desulfurase